MLRGDDAARAAERLDAWIVEVPKDPLAHALRGALHARQGERMSALERFKRAARLAPERAAFAHLVRSAGGAGFDAPLRGEVVELFDRYAPSFDAHLVEELAYRGHRALAERLGERVAAEGALDVVDLGCGTGLSGEPLRPFARRLDGVDLSPAMVAQARAKGIYDAVWVADLVEALLSLGDASVDVIAAADVLGYVGALDAVFEEARRVLRPGGRLAFTVESLGEGQAPFALGDRRRFAFSDAYLTAMCARYGLAIEALAPERLRRESARDVLGRTLIARAGA